MVRMWMLATIAALTSSCTGGDSPDPPTEEDAHELVTCDRRWKAYMPDFVEGETQCETACADLLLLQDEERNSFDGCYFDSTAIVWEDGRVPGEKYCPPGRGIDWNGFRGCCDYRPAPVIFKLCKP